MALLLASRDRARRKAELVSGEGPLTLFSCPLLAVPSSPWRLDVIELLSPRRWSLFSHTAFSAFFPPATGRSSALLLKHVRVPQCFSLPPGIRLFLCYGASLVVPRSLSWAMRAQAAPAAPPPPPPRSAFFGSGELTLGLACTCSRKAYLSSRTPTLFFFRSGRAPVFWATSPPPDTINRFFFASRHLWLWHSRMIRSSRHWSFK